MTEQPAAGRRFYDYCPDGKNPQLCSSCTAERIKDSRRQHHAAPGVPLVPDPSKLPLIPDADRFKHIYIPGMTGYGKSTLLFWMAAQDIFQGKGVCVIDPKGDLVRSLLDYIPESRKDDVIWLDLDETPVAIDFMDYEGEREKERLIGELRILLTHQVDTQHAPLMSANIQAILYCLFDFNDNPATRPECRATFLDIERFLTYESRRKEIMAGVTSPKVRHLWLEAQNRREGDGLPPPIEIKRITTRTSMFSLSDSLTKVFDAPQPKLNIGRAMEEKKILLVNIGGVDEVQRAYGTLLVSKIRDAAYRRANLKYRRIPYFLYCDEFQEFQTSDFGRMLSMARGFGLGLTLAHQFTSQLESKILDAIFGNASTVISFQVGINDAPKLKPLLKVDDAATLMDIPEGVARYRDARGRCSWVYTPKPVDWQREHYKPTGFAEYIKKRTVEQYSSPTLQFSYTEAHSRSDDADDPTKDNIDPGPEPDVPPNPSRKKRPRPRR